MQMTPLRKAASIVAVSGISILLAACAEHSNGSIKGEVHLRNEEFQLSPVSNAELSLCPEAVASSQTAAAARSEKDYGKLCDVVEKLDREIQSEKIQSARSDESGKYSFSHLSPGFYNIFAKSKTDTKCSFWMAPVLVIAGKETSLNLDLANLGASATK